MITSSAIYIARFRILRRGKRHKTLYKTIPTTSNEERGLSDYDDSHPSDSDNEHFDNYKRLYFDGTINPVSCRYNPL